VVRAIEDGWIQLRLAERGLERKRRNDSGDNVVVGQNHFRRDDEQVRVGEVFHLDPTIAERVLQKYEKLMDTRSHAEVEGTLARLAKAAREDRDNVMPYLVDCCHAYATVGEMVATLKREWGEFQEPVGL
jgi:methylmalonyl-CoA mutase N-terminal domain/subunit